MYEQPHEVTDVDMTFPTALGDLIPNYEDIPKEFKNPTSNIWQLKLQRDWFFRGLDKGDLPEPKEGIDREKALRHMACIQGSFEPKHEHKAAAVAYLFDLWFQPPK